MRACTQTQVVSTARRARSLAASLSLSLLDSGHCGINGSEIHKLLKRGSAQFTPARIRSAHTIDLLS